MQLHTIALKDIKDDIESNNVDIHSYYTVNGDMRVDTWYCFGATLYNSEQCELNRLIGVHKVNKSNSITNIKRRNN